MRTDNRFAGVEVVIDRVCPRCGQVFSLPAGGPGRRPVWCSAQCRRRASAERTAANNTGQPIQIVEVPRGVPAPAPLPPAPTLHRILLATHPDACVELLDEIAGRYRTGQLPEPVADAVERLAKTTRPSDTPQAPKTGPKPNQPPARRGKKRRR